MKFIHPSFYALVKKFVDLGVLIIENGSKHAKIRHKVTKDWIAVAGSPSDHRSLKNFKANLKNLVTYGKGTIYQKTGRLAAQA